MDSDRWKRINTIFHDALDLPPGDRKSFVSAATVGDEQLQLEVEALLRADEGAGSYLESPLLAQDSESIETPILQEGTLLCARFRIIRKIAEGGMGQVYEASDTELGTQVAVKVIRPEIASDPAVLARFRQEVKLARRITHPNVCRTYDFERDVIQDEVHGTRRDIYFLTMEFLPGETLASRIRRTGALSGDDAVAIARQIADAIDGAHSLGIIHRDLKPANVMLTPVSSEESNVKGRAVITDFGLARLVPMGPDDEAQSISKFQGWPIGTLAYMSPEQLQSSKVSSATDIYSFGLILFEMITGRRAFPAENFLEGIAQRIAGLSPQMEPKIVPQRWRDAIHWCIRANPTERPPSGAAVIAILTGIRGRPRVQRRIRTIWKKPALWVTGLILVSASAYYLYRPSPSTLRVLDYQQLTRDGADKYLAGTDGTWLYMADSTARLSRVSVYGGEIEGISSTKLPATPYVEWDMSRDGSKVMIQVIENENQMGLWCARVDGGSATRIAIDEHHLLGSFTPDGNSVIYLTNNRDLRLVRVDGTGDRKLASLGSDATEAMMSPDGKRIRIIKGNTFWEMSSDGSGLHRLFPDWHGPPIIHAGIWSLDGSIYAFLEYRAGEGSNQIWAIDERRSFLKRPSYPVPLTSGPMFWDRPFPGVNGSEIYGVGREFKGELSRVDLRSGELRPYLGGISADHVAFSPDRNTLVYTAYPLQVLWRANRDGSNPVQMTGETLHSVSNPTWSPDGKQVLFANAPRFGTPKAYLVPAKGGSPIELLPGDKETQADPNWSPDGRQIVLTGGNPSNTSEQYIRILDLASHRLTMVPASKGYWSPRWSSDGQYLAALSGQRGSLMIFNLKTQRWATIKVQNSVDYLTFSKDSRYLYFLMLNGVRAIRGVYRVAISGGHPEQVFEVTMPLVNLAGVSMSLDPTDAPILTRSVGTCDIYALHVSH